jgi:hypothetical protein
MYDDTLHYVIRNGAGEYLTFSPAGVDEFNAIDKFIYWDSTLSPCAIQSVKEVAQYWVRHPNYPGGKVYELRLVIGQEVLC